MSILFNQCASLLVDPTISTSARSIIISSQQCLFHPFQVVFVFRTHPPFFFEDSDFLFKYPFIHVKSLHSFQTMFLSGDSHEDTNICLFFSGGSNSSFRCCSYSFPYFKCFLMPVKFLIIHFFLSICSGVLKISQKAHLFIQDPFKLFGDYYLIQVI